MIGGLDDRVDILRAPLITDTYHADGARDWVNAVTIAADVPASVQPQSSTEETTDRQAVVTTWRVFLPPGVDVEPEDRIALGALVLDVDGEPMRWREGGTEHHVEAQAKRSRG